MNIYPLKNEIFIHHIQSMRTLTRRASWSRAIFRALSLLLHTRYWRRSITAGSRACTWRRVRNPYTRRTIWWSTSTLCAMRRARMAALGWLACIAAWSRRCIRIIWLALILGMWSTRGLYRRRYVARRLKETLKCTLLFKLMDAMYWSVYSTFIY